MNRHGKRRFTVFVVKSNCPKCGHGRAFEKKTNVGRKCTRCGELL